MGIGIYLRITLRDVPTPLNVLHELFVEKRRCCERWVEEAV